MGSKSKFTWVDAIIEVLKKHDNVATLKILHNEAPSIYSKYNTILGKTPFQTIKERVQRDKRITKLAPGLYTITENIDNLPKKYNPNLQTKQEKDAINHISVHGTGTY